MIHVLKFGGSSLGREDLSIGLKRIQSNIDRHIQKHDKLIIVMSAFLGKTRELRELSASMFNVPNSPQEDAILSQGEAESSSFLYTHLNKCGYKVTLLNVQNIPLITDNSFGSAEILFINKQAIEKTLQDNDILIIPGFVGRNVDNITTTLGFDGSDTTAVYIAGTMKCECTLFKDVTGIFTVNPRKVTSAKLLDNLNREQALKLALLGSNLVHPKALSAANIFNIDILVKPHFTDAYGTRISRDIAPSDIAGITYKDFGSTKSIVSVVGESIQSHELKLILHKCNYIAEYYSTPLPGTSSVMIEKEILPVVLITLHSHYGLDDNSSTQKFIGNGKLPI